VNRGRRQRSQRPTSFVCCLVLPIIANAWYHAIPSKIGPIFPKGHHDSPSSPMESWTYLKRGGYHGFVFAGGRRQQAELSCSRVASQRSVRRGSRVAKLRAATETMDVSVKSRRGQQVKKTTFADLATCPELQCKASCCFLDGASIISTGEGVGYGLVATRDLKARTVILAEQRSISEVPDFLAPRTAKEIPPVNMGLPLFLVPKAVFELFPPLLRALRISQNAYSPLSLYVTGSVVNHACRPNAQWVHWPDGMRALVTQRNFSAGEELTTSYLGDQEMNMPRWRRRLSIFWRYGFQCECQACQGNSCPDAPDSSVMDFDEYQKIRELVDKMRLKSDGTYLCSVSAQQSKDTQLPRLLPLMVLQTILIVLPVLGIISAIPDSWVS